MKTMRQAFNSMFPKIKIWERTIQLQSVQRAAKTVDEVAAHALKHDDGRFVAGQTGMPQQANQGNEMGDITIVGDIDSRTARKAFNSQRPSVIPSLAKAAAIAALGASGLGAAYFIADAIKHRPVQPVTDTDTDTSINYGLYGPGEAP